MHFIGIDLHKKSITLCVVNQQRTMVAHKTLTCVEPQKIVKFCQVYAPFHVVVEATASYEWLWELLQSEAERLVLAHPKKLRVIAESTRKSDRLDAKVLAEFLALDMIPQAYRPTRRERQHRVLVRQRDYWRKRSASAKNKIRGILSNYNADREDLFKEAGLKYLAELNASSADRFVLRQLLGLWRFVTKQRLSLDKALAAFAKQAPSREAEARAVLATIPGIGAVTIDIVLSELGDIARFRSTKRVSACAGLVPGLRESAGHTKELSITKEGSRLLRWALVEAAWRLIRRSQRWHKIYESLRQRRGKKKAIVAVARRLLGVMVALLRTGQPYAHDARRTPATAG